MKRISFKLIPVFERYRIYSDGRVWDSWTEKFIKQHSSNGYFRVYLAYDSGRSSPFFIHRLVAQAFCYNDDPEHKTCVDHIDTNPSNNSVFNLHWVSYRGNCANPLTRQHMSEGQTGRVPWNKGVEMGPMPEEHKTKISVSMKGKNTEPKSEDHKLKLSQVYVERNWKHWKKDPVTGKRVWY